MTDQRRRWDTDVRGRGVADATAFASAIDELATLVRTPEWVAEDPEVHLVPHLSRAIGERPGLALLRTDVVDGVLIVDIEVRGATDDRAGGGAKRAARSLALELVASVAEPVTFVREGVDSGIATFDVVTGVPPTDGGFATHGHSLRLRLHPGPDEE